MKTILEFVREAQHNVITEGAKNNVAKFTNPEIEALTNNLPEDYTYKTLRTGSLEITNAEQQITICKYDKEHPYEYVEKYSYDKYLSEKNKLFVSKLFETIADNIYFEFKSELDAIVNSDEKIKKCPCFRADAVKYMFLEYLLFDEDAHIPYLFFDGFKSLKEKTKKQLATNEDFNMLVEEANYISEKFKNPKITVLTGFLARKKTKKSGNKSSLPSIMFGKNIKTAIISLDEMQKNLTEYINN